MYIGATKDEAPTAKPRTAREAIKDAASGDRADQRAAHVNTRPTTNFVHLRLRESASFPETNAPATAPRSKDPTTQDCPNDPQMEVLRNVRQCPADDPGIETEEHAA